MVAAVISLRNRNKDTHMCSGQLRTPNVLEVASESILAWRSLGLAAVTLAVMGFLTWISYATLNVEDRTMKGYANSVLILNQKVSIQDLSHVQRNPIDLFSQKVAPTYCQIKECSTVYCSFIQNDPGMVASQFIESHFEVDCKDMKSIKLIFDNCQFPSNKLRKNWLPTSISIEELTLQSCSLIEIEENAFVQTIYAKTKKISIIGNKILALKKGIFRYLSSLEHLTIGENIVKQAETNLLENVADTLTVLELYGAIDDLRVLQNIINGTVPLRVEILSIRGNSIPVIDSDTFAGVPKVKSLYVEQSEVETVAVDAFSPVANSLLQLHMSNNNIRSLPDGLFDFLYDSNQPFRLAIENNPWHCDCNMKWMKDLIEHYPRTVINIPTCKTPEINGGKLFTRANFCDSTEPTSTAVTTISSTEADRHSTSNDPEITDGTIKLSCSISTVSFRTVHTRKLLSSHDFQLQSRFRSFTVSERDGETIQIDLPDLNSDLTLIWFDSNDERSVKCARNMKRSYTLQNLQPGTSYTVCLLHDDERTVSPLNCLAVTTNSSEQTRAWLTNSDKTMVFATLCGVVFLLLIFSAFFTFCVIRRYPTLLRGSKRVMLVKRRNLDAIILPKGVEIGPETPRNKEVTSIRKTQEDGYVTPLPPHRNCMTTRKGSRVSRVSLQSDGNSYVSEVEPTMMQLTSWRLRRMKSQLEKLEDSVPPTPPPPRKLIPSLSMTVDSADDEQKDYSSCTV